MTYPATDHANADVSMVFSVSGQFAWIQTGWYSGTVGLACPYYGKCIRRLTTIGKFNEWYNPNVAALYRIYDNGQLSLSGSAQYWIEYISASGCWAVKVDGSSINNVCQQSAHGAPYAGSEVYDSNLGSQGPVQMAVANFGNANPNSPSALRIKGATGFQPWDSSLTSYATSRHDESTSAPAYHIYHYNYYHLFQVYD